jgi:VIT1/CCC1 family predicted Fe2+/Mn2+ transporter
MATGLHLIATGLHLMKQVLVIVLGVSTSWAKEAGRPWRREAAAYERRRDLAMGEMRGLSDGLAALAAKNAALERERNELRDKLSKQVRATDGPLIAN